MNHPALPCHKNCIGDSVRTCVARGIGPGVSTAPPQRGETTGTNAEVNNKMNRRQPRCLLEDIGPMTDRMSRRDREENAGDAIEDSIRFSTPRERWMMLLKLICAQYPHCIMYGVHIADGVIISCEAMQQSLLFGRPALAVRGSGAPAFGANWQALEVLCQRMGTGQLAELRFSDGEPVRAKTTPRGRRFRYFIND